MKAALTIISKISWKYVKLSFCFSSCHWTKVKPTWGTVPKLEIRLHTVLLRETLLKQKKNLQPVRFRWTASAKHKHRCLPESLPESRHPRLTKIKFSYHHRQNTDKEPTVYSCKPNIIYLREYLLHNSSEFN